MPYLSLEQAFTNFLLAKSTITTYTSTRIYPVVSLDRTLPYVLVTSDDEQPIPMDLDGNCDVAEKTLKVILYTANYLQLVNLHEAIRQELQGFIGSLGGIAVWYVKPSGVMDHSINPPDASGTFIYRRALSFESKYWTPPVTFP